MDGFGGIKNRWLATVVCVVLLAVGGCKEASTSSPQENTPGEETLVRVQPGETDGLDAETIMRRLQDRYSSAKTYQDHGVLYLSYRLQGQYIEEPQQWSTVLDRDGNRIAVEVFNSRIRGNGHLLSCFIFDIETANLDNQHRLSAYDSQIPIDELYRDSIAKHFLGGYSELPLDESDLASVPKLIPAPVSLLTNQLPSGWLQNPDRIQRLADETVDQIPCYVVRCRSDDMTADVWISRASWTLVQMSLPLKLLVGEVITTPDEITDVVLLARFHDATIDGQVVDEIFSIPTRSDSTPVKKFVALPETFPSEMIGKQAPDFRLLTPQGEQLTKHNFAGKVTALLWVAGHTSYAAMEQLSDIAKPMPESRFNFAAIYSESELKQPGSGRYETNEIFSQASASINLPVYFDSNLAASSALGIKVIPSVIVLDENARVHFARALSDTSWPTDLTAALRRVAAGEDVASEMQKEYDRFIASYQQQLETVSAAEWVGQPGSSISGSRGANTTHIRPQKVWSNSSFKKPGNVTVVDSPTSDEKSILIFDGWQTIVEVSSSGNTIVRHELQLPTENGTSQIRVGRINQNPIYALFDPLGKQVHLFDQSWNPMAIYPHRDRVVAGISDCQFVDVDADGNSELIVAFQGKNGIHRFDPTSGQSEKISDLAANSIALLNNQLIVAADGQISRIDSGRMPRKDSELDFQRLFGAGNTYLCGLGMTANGQWNAIGMNEKLERTWAISVGPPFFETGTTPVAVTRSANGHVVWAVADTENQIHLISGNGKWLGDLHSKSGLTGIGLMMFEGRTHLIMSTETGVECWDLNLPDTPGVTPH